MITLKIFLQEIDNGICDDLIRCVFPIIINKKNKRRAYNRPLKIPRANP